MTDNITSMSIGELAVWASAQTKEALVGALITMRAGMDSTVNSLALDAIKAGPDTGGSRKVTRHKLWLDLGAELRVWRNREELTTADADKLCGFNTGYWNSFERAQTFPSKEQSAAIKTASGIDAEKYRR